MREKLSAVIITKNEEANIRRCLQALDFADEIVVVDSGSTDGTISICNEFNCRVINSDWLGFGKTKKLAVDKAAHDWVLSIDSDEVVSNELKDSILRILEAPGNVAYLIKRNSFYLNRMIKHCGWNEDYPLRLFNKRHGNFNDKAVHESVVIKGERGRVEAPIYHYTYPTIESHIYKINRYTDLAAEELLKMNKSYSVFASALFGVNKFIKMYVLKMGFLDGIEGLILCINSAYGVFLKYLKTWKRG